MPILPITPEIKPRSSAHVIDFVSFKAQNRGIRAIQAIKPEPYLGNDKNNSMPLRAAKSKLFQEKSVFCADI
jgi:hypothetical protein